MSDRLERALLALGEHLEYPPSPHFEVPAIAPSPGRVRSRRAIAAVVVAVVLVVLAFPGPRRAIADLFGIGSVTLTFVDELPPLQLETPLPGVSSSLADAQELADFELLILEEEPDAVYFSSAVPGGMVTLVYGESETAYKLLITQLLANPEQPALEKLLAGSTVRSVEIDGTSGFWIEGEPHAIIVLDRDGQVVEDSGRLAGNTLLFVRDGVTVRVEGLLTLDQALEIADRL